MSNLKPPKGFVPDPKLQPSPEGPQSLNIRPGSKLAVLGVFVEVVRRRFSTSVIDPTSFPYMWDSDIKKAKVAVETSFNEDKGWRDFRPAVFVDCDDQTHGRVVLGDRAGKNMQSGLEGFWDLQTVPILIECIASKRAESAIIGDLVGTFLHASSDLIQAKFGLHDMTPVTVGRTQPTTRDKDQWVTAVTFNVQYPGRWTSEPTAPLLREIEMDIARSGVDNATDYFETIALGWRTST